MYVNVSIRNGQIAHLPLQQSLGQCAVDFCPRSVCTELPVTTQRSCNNHILCSFQRKTILQNSINSLNFLLMRKLFKYMIVFVYTVVHTMQLVKQHNNIMTDISSSTGITDLYSLSLFKCYYIHVL